VIVKGEKMTNIILCGGSGTRLWPLSRKLMPKQFLKLFDNKSLFQLTIDRNRLLCDDTLIVVNEEQYFVALDQLDELELNPNFVLESVAKNTAPAIALACMQLDYDEVVLVTPSDHLIKNQHEYEIVVNKANELALNNYLVTFGIKPTYAHTGYGYIEANGLDVVKFHEKPDSNKAQEYINKQNYYWNSGIFCFKAGVFLDELHKYAPKTFKSIENAFINKKGVDNQIRIPFEYMKSIVEDSIDYAVMEKSDKVKVLESDIEWNDVGSFDSLINEIDSKNAIEIESNGNFYYSDNYDKIIATIGLEDYIVVDTKDALLITKKGLTQKVKDITKQLDTSHTTLNIHSVAHRPWGTYEVLVDDNGYKIKRIIVKPQKRLSLQKHFHRNEHWIVVSGTAKVTVGEETYLLRPNESTYIKMGEVHRLENPGKIPVIMIEAQVGEYTNEDDIIRLEDDFKRGK
jgi:mannose-1-phosphate guanylyltransferase